MAFKIVYGAGQTINLHSQSGFGSGYGFLQMHRDERVTQFAVEKLERRLVGNSYRFERGEEWGQEAIPISTYQRCGPWHVLSRLRPIGESRGRSYFLAEFLLVDEGEARDLAALPGGGVVPAEILRSTNSDLWFQGDTWDQPGQWLEGSLDLCGIFRSGMEFDARFARPAFEHHECVWETDRAAEWTPDSTLFAMAATQKHFLKKYEGRIAGVSRPGDACFELAWNRLSLTSFYLDPGSGLDLDFGERDGALPFTWTGVFSRIPLHQLWIDGARESGNLLMTTGTEEATAHDPEALSIAAGWILPLPEPSKVQAAASSQSQPVAHQIDKGKPNQKQKQPGIFSRLLANPALIAIVVASLLGIAVIGYVVSRVLENRKVQTVITELQTTKEDGAKLLTILEEKQIGDSWNHKRFTPYLAFRAAHQRFQSYLTASSPQDQAHAAAQVEAVEKDLERVTPALELWSFAKAHQPRSVKEPTALRRRLEVIDADLRIFLVESSRSDRRQKALKSDLAEEWARHEEALTTLALDRLGNLVADLERRKTTSAPELVDKVEDAVSTLQNLPELPKVPKDRLRQIRDRLAKFKQPAPAGTPKTEPASTPPAPEPSGLLSSAKVVSRNTATLPYPHPQSIEGSEKFVDQRGRYSSVYEIDSNTLSDILKNARWEHGTLRMHIPRIDSVAGLKSVTANDSNVKDDKGDIGRVDSTDYRLFQFADPPDMTPVTGLVAKTGEDRHELWLYWRGALEAEISPAEFFPFPEGNPPPIESDSGISGIDDLAVTVLAEHQSLGTVQVRLPADAASFKSEKELGNLLVARSESLAKARANLEAWNAFKRGRDGFRTWYLGSPDAPATPASTLFSGVVEWATDARTGEIVPRPEPGPILSQLGSLKNSNVLQQAPPQDAGAGQLEFGVVNLVVEACLRAKGQGSTESLSSFLPNEDPTHVISGLSAGEMKIDTLLSKLAGEIALYDPKPPPLPPEPSPEVTGEKKEGTPEKPPAEDPQKARDRKIGELKAKNGQAMKKNWEAFHEDLDEIGKLAKWIDGQKGQTLTSVIAAIDSAAVKLEELKNVEAAIRKLDGVTFRLRVGPKTNP